MNTLPKWVWIVVLLAVVLGGAVLLKGDRKEVAQTGPVKIGVSIPLSGEAASYGEAGRAGLELALKEINEAGGINGRPVELVYEDDKCGTSAATVFQKLVNVDKVSAIIGPVCSPAAGPAIPIARAAGVPTIMIGASAPGLAGGDDSIFSGYASDTLQGRFVAEYVYNTMGKRKVAVLYEQNDWGQGLQKVFVERFTELGGTVVFNEGVAQDVTDVRQHVAKIKASEPDLIYLPVFPALASISVRQLKEQGVTVQVVGGDALVGEEFLNSGVADGVMFITGAVGTPDDFKAKVAALNGEDAVINIITPLGYDALKVLAKVMTEEGTDPKDVIKGLKKLDYAGISFPRISFDGNGDLKEATYEVNIVRGNKPEVIKQ